MLWKKDVLADNLIICMHGRFRSIRNIPWKSLKKVLQSVVLLKYEILHRFFWKLFNISRMQFFRTSLGDYSYSFLIESNMQKSRYLIFLILNLFQNEKRSLILCFTYQTIISFEHTHTHTHTHTEICSNFS